MAEPAVETVAGHQPTGRKLRGPGFEWVELLATNGLKHVALCVDALLRSHGSLNQGLMAALPFMEHPDVVGLPSMRTGVDGAFVYPTGTVWPVAELLVTQARAGEGGGVRAGLELCYLAGQVLVEAAEKGRPFGLRRHGFVTPWHLVVKADGQVEVLGYGVPPTEILRWRVNQRSEINVDSLRYAPPERLDVEANEDVQSDIYSLCLVAMELILGKPVYDGLTEDVKNQATRGEAMRRLYQWRDLMPETVREVMGRALRPDRDGRFRDANEFVHAVHDLLGSVDADGPSLAELVARTRSAAHKGKAFEAGKTGTLSAAALAELMAEALATPPKELPPPRKALVAEPDEPDEPAEQPRWSRASRAGEPAPPARAERGAASRAAPAERAAPAGRLAPRGASAPSSPDRADALRDRLKRGAPSAEPAEDANSARERLLSRLRERDAPRAPAVEPNDARDALKRRLRRPGDPPTAEVPLPVAPVAEPVVQAPVAPEPAPAAAEPAPAPVVDTAQALLARLRGSAAKIEAAVASPVLPPAAEPPPLAPAVEPAAQESASSEAEAVSEPDVAAPLYSEAYDEAEGEAPAVEALGAQQSSVRTFYVSVDDSEASALEIAAPPPGAGALVEALGVALGVATRDLMGRTLGGFRCFTDEDRVWPGAATSELPDNLYLYWVENTLLNVTFSVPGALEQRFQAPVGAMVPAHAIASHLATWLGLGAGSWRLSLGGELLDPYTTLVDVDLSIGAVELVRT